MMRALLTFALVGIMAGSASADLVTPLTPTATFHGNAAFDGTVGPLIGMPPVVVNSNQSIPGVPSSNIVVTFGIHWPYLTGAVPVQFHYTLEYDNSEVAVIGTQALGQFAGGLAHFLTNQSTMSTLPGGTVVTNTGVNGFFNTGSANFQVDNNQSGGIVREDFFANGGGFGLTPNASITTESRIVFFDGLHGSDTIPFLRVTAQVKDFGPSDGLNDIRVQATPAFAGNTGFFGFNSFILSTTVDVPLTNGQLISPYHISRTLFGTAGGAFAGFTSQGGSGTGPFGVDILPEPASASLALLIIGLASMSGGFWQRRRTAR